MRILIDYRPALVQRTGVGEYAHQMAMSLAASLQPSDTLALFSSSWKDRLAPGRVPGASTVDARVPVRVLNLAWHRLEWPAAEWFAGPVDVAHSMHPLLMPARRAAQVVTIYDLFFMSDATGTAAEIKRDYVALTAAHARRADAVIVISDYTARQVASQLGVPAERIALCPPGAPAWSPRQPPATQGPILFVGSAERRKNLPTLLRAYARLRERMPATPPLVLAGQPPHRLAEIQAMMRRPPWFPHVRHLGYVNDDERMRLYREASLLVLPSLDEGFGMPALEAMTLGVPVVAAARGALPEVVGNAGLLVDPSDEEALAEAMRRMLEDGSFSRQCVARGLERAAAFSWQRSAARLRQAYGEATARREARASSRASA